MTVAARELAAVGRFGARLYWRDKVALSTSVALSLGLGIGLPLMMDRIRPGHPEMVLAQHLGVLAMILTIATFSQIAVTLTARRDQLLLKRMRATGLADRDILGGEIANLVVQTTLLTGVVSVALYTLTGLRPPRDPLLYLTAVVAGCTVLCLLGAAITVIIPRTEVAAVVTMPFFLLSGLGAGGFGPMTELLPGWVRSVLDLLPTAAIVEASRVAYAAGGTLVGDLRAAAVPALTLAVWAVAALLVIRRWFRWETRKP
ncbi:ABC-2 type transport system permease protein [Streptosporangium becharense]|uniref:ABC-2 type transport system permease protein n=1 Tax=Streptosporangium becharense TaxID=1816182 RepID=A0A7W9ID76_9ACTN|nr:ABC transporter permease [Streptosporangium becharense]MBB2911960.1 ABC-2 type transport system permease protein [Streptosporangium becharense]MBB5818507.1 ABC-2 type transport system permease protein [Streptosporangium becharense]